MSQRHLILHASALSDAEYAVYTAGLKDLNIGDAGGHEGQEEDDEYFAQMQIGVREARAWLRGRYGDVPSQTVDMVLRFFSTSLAAADTLKGTEFFAAVRLVAHANNNAFSAQDMDREMAFVQADPTVNLSHCSTCACHLVATSSTHAQSSLTRYSPFSQSHPSQPPSTAVAPPPPLEYGSHILNEVHASESMAITSASRTGSQGHANGHTQGQSEAHTARRNPFATVPFASSSVSLLSDTPARPPQVPPYKALNEGAAVASPAYASPTSSSAAKQHRSAPQLPAPPPSRTAHADLHQSFGLVPTPTGAMDACDLVVADPYESLKKEIHMHDAFGYVPRADPLNAFDTPTAKTSARGKSLLSMSTTSRSVSEHSKLHGYRGGNGGSERGVTASRNNRHDVSFTTRATDSSAEQKRPASVTSSLRVSAEEEYLTHGFVEYEKRGNGESGANMFSRAENVQIYGGSFHATSVTHYGESQELRKIYDMAAPNAILNAGGRAEEVRCHPGTRKLLIRLIEEWAWDAQRGLVPRLCWLSGPAGAGKTAIAQTIAERRIDRGEPQANFFFFRTDASRRTADPFVPTLLYQILQLYPDLRHTVGDALRKDPLLLDKPSDLDKFNLLIRAPFEAILQPTPGSHPVMLIIDGLDECNTTKPQQQIIHALGRLATDEHSPFVVLLSSRQEHHIEMAIRPLDNSVQRIFLDETYSPHADIALFVEDEFRRIKKEHPLAGTLDQARDWPSSQDVWDIVSKSSGQFIYAAVVMRFISESSASPELSLEKVQGIVSVGSTSPFSQLDSVYTFILSQAYDWPITYELLALQLTLSVEHQKDISTLLSAYRRQNCTHLVKSCVYSLSAIMHLSKGGLTFYHKSLADFLLDKTRSETYWIDIDTFRLQFIQAMWTSNTTRETSVVQTFFDKVTQPTQYITDSLVNKPPPQWMRNWVQQWAHMCTFPLTLGNPKDKLQQLYDRPTFISIIQNYKSHGVSFLDGPGHPLVNMRLSPIYTHETPQPDIRA